MKLEQEKEIINKWRELGFDAEFTPYYFTAKNYSHNITIYLRNQFRTNIEKYYFNDNDLSSSTMRLIAYTIEDFIKDKELMENSMLDCDE